MDLLVSDLRADTDFELCKAIVLNLINDLNVKLNDNERNVAV